MTHVNDYADIGYFPLQDQSYADNDVPLGARAMMVGARLIEQPLSDDPRHSVIGADSQMGTLGDVHPWLFWQTRDRAERDMGSWSQATVGIVMDGDPIYAKAEVQPFYGDGYYNDSGYALLEPEWAKATPYPVKGQWRLMFAGTREDEQQVMSAPIDGRLVAPSTEGPAEAGTMVVDLQPTGTLCLDEAATPGTLGRAARLQNLVRVVTAQPGQGVGGFGGWNMLALNWGKSPLDNTPNLGAVFMLSDQGVASGPITGGNAAGNGGVAGGPITGGPGGSGSSSLIGGGGGESSAQVVGGPGNGGVPGSQGGGSDFTSDGSDELQPHEFGEFAEKMISGHVVAFMSASGNAWGPITPGSPSDKHRHGTDRDGHPCNSAHISTRAFYYQNQEKDAPLDFSAIDYPDNVGSHPFATEVHLSYHANKLHAFKGSVLPGMWRWWTTTPTLEPSDPPGDPITPGGGQQPPTGGGGGGGSGVPTGGGGGGGNKPGNPGGNRPGSPTGGKPTGGPSTGGHGRKGPRPRLTTDPEYEKPLLNFPYPPYGPYAPPKLPPPSGGGEGGEGGSKPQGPITGPRGKRMPTGGHGEPSTGNPGEGDPDPPQGGGAGGGSNDPCKTLTNSLLPGQTGVSLDNDVLANAILPNGISTPIAHRIYQHGDPQTNAHSFMGPGGGGSLSVDPRVEMGRLHGRNPWSNEPQTVPGVIPTIGTTTQQDVGAYALFHPIAEGFAAIQFRPQCWVRGAPNLEHNPQIPGRFGREDERVRPQVMSMRAFGALNAEDYEYVQRPEYSRARGGTGNGGVLLSPPRFEMEDYLDVGVGVSTDVDDVTSDAATDSLWMLAPGVRFALGKPNRDGSAKDGAAFFQHDPLATVPGKITTQVSGAVVDMLTLHSDSGEIALEANGTDGFMLPAGTTAQRPTATVQAGMVRWNTTTSEAEVYDGSAWTALGGGGGIEVIDQQDGNPYTSLSTTTESDAYSFTIPANTMPGKTVRLKVWGMLKNGSGSDQNCSLRFDFEGTEYHGSQFSVANGNERPFWLEVMIQANTASEVSLFGRWSVGSDTSPSGTGNPISNVTGIHRDGVFSNDTIAEDATKTITVDLRQNWVTSATDSFFDVYGATVEAL